MTIKESVLYALGKIGKPSDYMEVYNYIIEHNLHDFGEAKTPMNTVNAFLGNFVKKGDERVMRKKNSKGTMVYFLTENQDNIQSDSQNSEIKVNFKERDLHKLFTTYLHNQKISAKTIFHEKSEHGKDRNLKWVHPDIVGVSFSNLHSKEAKHLLETANKMDSFKLLSYELKCSINNDYDLKQYFFQAVSNSSWANYGYLVTFEFNDELKDEMERLNQSFGIGIIHLKPNPFESKILYPAVYHKLDFKTIDKLCRANKDFSSFIECVEKYISAEERYSDAQREVLEKICDSYFENDSEIETYCKEKGIEIEE